ncbi:MAG: flagellar hook protein FlgE [Tepidanaerobacteraceae bacterium]|nr:flagellar hook protein FlgE [Tepidanaerobacteraceae bacterium]
MMRSMFSAVTGLKNFQTKMDVIGNNIANVNTVGYKKSRVTFQDTLSQTMRGAASPQGNRGGTNPMQVGLGMNIATIDTIHSPSSFESTGYATDLAIDGDGFFIVSDGLNRYYTRAGNFTFDELGNFVNSSNGLKVVGWQDSQTYTVPSDKSPQNLNTIIIKKGMMMEAKATGAVSFAKNLNSETDSGESYVLPFKIYDSLGQAHNLKIAFTKSATDNQWNYSITSDDTALTIDTTSNSGTLQFTTEGALDLSGSTVNAVNITVNGANSISFTPDFNELTQYASDTTVDMDSQDGYSAGSLLSISIDTNGVISGVFDNGQSRELAQIALANFTNPGGLIKAGNNLYQYSNNSGEPQIGTAGTSGRGTVSPGNLEMSNVDLSEEFTQMIITQRGFQANSRIITTSDEMLQELVNLKR